MNDDVSYIKETLRLAKKGIGWTNPNPLVGAVIVKNGKILGKGYHHKIGNPHAEIEALRSTTEDITGATIYINLEPCSHFGRTPPCAEAVIKSGLTRVVFANTDPNPKVAGKGMRLMQKAGIEVISGVLEEEAWFLNEAFFTFHEKNRPFVAIKFAASLDGKIATKTNDSKWITNKKARRMARKLRSHYQAILVGSNTVIHDDPHLGTRQRGKKEPLRIILDSTLSVPLESQVLRDTNVLIATTERADKKKKRALQKKGIGILEFTGNKIPLPELLQKLREKDIISVFVEGGGSVLGSFVDTGLVDKVYAFHAPIIVGGKEAISAVQGNGSETIQQSLHLKKIYHKLFEDTLLTIGYTN